MAATHRQTLPLSQPLKRVRVSYYGPQPVTGRDIPALERQAYINGQQDAQDLCQQQIMEARDAMRRLQDEVLSEISQRHQILCDAFDEQVPDLVMRIVRKVLAGLEIDRETVIALVEETLAEVAPQTDTLDLCLNPKDAALFRLSADRFQSEYPGLTLIEDASLNSGDVVLRSRFGIIDARLETKMKRIEAQLKGVQE